MRFTIRGISLQLDVGHAVLVISLVLVMTITGPFGTYNDFGFWQRLGYWSIAIGAVGFFGITIGRYFHTSMRFDHLHPIAVSLLSSAVASIPGTLVIWQLEVSWRELSHDEGALPQILLGVFAVCAPATALRFATWRALLAKPDKPSGRPSEVIEQDAKSPFLARLPKELGHELISLSMNDHYVECVTTRGNTLVLMRFADALRELETYPGLQIHRSHWVAVGWLRKIDRAGSRYLAALADGRKLPVSRTYLDAARAMASDGTGA